jgi:hypothetical protein
MQQIAAAERGALQGRGRASVVERCAEPAAEKFTSCPAAVGAGCSSPQIPLPWLNRSLCQAEAGKLASQQQMLRCFDFSPPLLNYYMRMLLV